MTKLEQAARQALEALEDIFGKGKVDVGAITALREALAEPHKQNCACEVCRGCDNADIKAEQAEQRSDSERMEPVAGIRWMPGLENIKSEYFEYGWADGKRLPVGAKLYTHPVRTKDLTDDEIEELMNREFPQNDWLWHYTRAVIAADREKNK